MKSRDLILCTAISFLSLLLSSGYAQENTAVQVSADRDTVLMDNIFKVTFSIENQEVTDFQAPVFENFEVMSGPNQTSAMTIINGTSSSTLSYSYYLKPLKEGLLFILPAKWTTEESTFFTEPLEIPVLPNPEGIIQQPKELKNKLQNFDSFIHPFFQDPPSRPAPVKKQRKTYRL